MLLTNNERLGERSTERKEGVRGGEEEQGSKEEGEVNWAS